MAERKRSLEESRIEAVLMDIEGTTTSISFVKDTLFPYVREHLDQFLTDNWEKDELKATIKLLKDQVKTDTEAKLEGVVEILDGDQEKETLVKNVLWNMDQDRKIKALKELQGQIWRKGYESKEIKGHIYPDVSIEMTKWTNDGRQLYIYSSGSEEAQKLLFGNTIEGDLLKLISGHFDTAIGAKTDVESYKTIVTKLGVPAEEILFLTDVVKEATAAEEAGLQTVIVIREGNIPLNDEESKKFTTVTSFADLTFGSNAKKQKLSEDTESDSKVTDNGEVQKSEETKETDEKTEMEVDPPQVNEKTENIEKTEVETKSEIKEIEKVKENNEVSKEVEEKKVEEKPEEQVECEKMEKEVQKSEDKVEIIEEKVETKKAETEKSEKIETEKTNDKIETEKTNDKIETEEANEKVETEKAEEKIETEADTKKVDENIEVKTSEAEKESVEIKTVVANGEKSEKAEEMETCDKVVEEDKSKTAVTSEEKVGEKLEKKIENGEAVNGEKEIVETKEVPVIEEKKELNGEKRENGNTLENGNEEKKEKAVVEEGESCKKKIPTEEPEEIPIKVAV